MLPYVRKSLIRTDFFGVDSFQGLLEAAEWYGDGHVVFRFPSGDVVNALNQLAAEGYVTLKWTVSEAGAQELSHLALTIKGHEHLRSLRERSAAGMVRRRSSDIAWIVIVSVVTTLVTLQARSCVGP